MQTNIAQYLDQHLRGADAAARVIYRHCVGADWQDITVAAVGALAARWQQAFRREGLVAGERVAICARNGLTWVAIDQAALGLGLVVVPLYVDDNAESVAWCVQNADARLLVVENSRLAAALAKGAAAAGVAGPAIVVAQPDAEDRASVSAAQYLPAAAPAFECRELPPATLATICYTSGTSGRPKGVMLTHGNIIANVEQCRATGLAQRDDCFLSILPLSHMFERTGGYYLPLAVGAKVVYGRGIAQLGEDLRTEAPTVIYAVPRIFEKTYQRIEQAVAASPFKRALFHASVTRGFRTAMGGATWLDRLLLPPLRALVAKPILGRMGGRMRLAVVGGAALDPQLARAFIGLGLPLLQGYGMTEASPVLSVNRLDDNLPESVGTPLPGVEVKLGEGGELLARGDNVMQGYWRNPEATAQALTADGWLRTGDVAEIRAGHITICGRVKDIVVMSNGEKLSPGDAEMAILRDSIFDQVLLVGEGRPFPILLAVSRERDEQALLKRANDQLKAFPRWVRMRRVIIGSEPWTVESGLMTPTLKLKRPKAYAEGAVRDTKPEGVR
jgi:long-chain acyl-CoA synthetase